MFGLYSVSECRLQTLQVRSKELERSRTRLQQQNSNLQQRLVALQLNDASVAPPTSPSTDTGQCSVFLSSVVLKFCKFFKLHDSIFLEIKKQKYDRQTRHIP